MKPITEKEVQKEVRKFTRSGGIIQQLPDQLVVYKNDIPSANGRSVFSSIGASVSNSTNGGTGVRRRNQKMQTVSHEDSEFAPDIPASKYQWI